MDLTEALRAAERRLQAAQRSGDADALDRLLHERLRFTGPDGALHTKQDDLDAHRSRALTFTEVVEEELVIEVSGRTGVTWVCAALAGTWSGEPFTDRVRYTRTWVHDDAHGWRVLAAHVSSAA